MWRRSFLLWDVVHRLSFYRKSSGHFTSGNDFSAVSESPAAAGDEQRVSWLTIEIPQSHWHDVGRRDVLMQPISVQASPSVHVSPPAGTCGRGHREKKQPTHHPRVDLCRRRSLTGKTAVGDEGLDAVPAGTMRWTVRKLVDDSASEVSQWTPSHPISVGKARRCPFKAVTMKTGWHFNWWGWSSLKALVVILSVTLNGPYQRGRSLSHGDFWLQVWQGTHDVPLLDHRPVIPTISCPSWCRHRTEACLAWAATIASRAIFKASSRAISHWPDRSPARWRLVQASTREEGVKGCCAVFKKNGDSPVEVWSEFLIANWQSGSNSPQLDCLWLTNMRRQSSTTRLIRSVIPSVCGWLAVLNCSFTPKTENTSLKKADVNLSADLDPIQLFCSNRDKQKHDQCTTLQHP